MKRKNRRLQENGRLREGRSKKERRGGDGKGDGKGKWGLAISNCWGIKSRHHARYLHWHYLSFPDHGTITVGGIILFMATQEEGILPFCFNNSYHKGHCKFQGNYPNSCWMIIMS